MPCYASKKVSFWFCLIYFFVSHETLSRTVNFSTRFLFILFFAEISSRPQNFFSKQKGFELSKTPNIFTTRGEICFQMSIQLVKLDKFFFKYQNVCTFELNFVSNGNFRLIFQSSSFSVQIYASLCFLLNWTQKEFVMSVDIKLFKFNLTFSVIIFTSILKRYM